MTLQPIESYRPQESLVPAQSLTVGQRVWACDEDSLPTAPWSGIVAEVVGRIVSVRWIGGISTQRTCDLAVLDSTPSE